MIGTIVAIQVENVGNCDGKMKIEKNVLFLNLTIRKIENVCHDHFPFLPMLIIFQDYFQNKLSSFPLFQVDLDEFSTPHRHLNGSFAEEKNGKIQLKVEKRVCV
jgi:hypothetical protein